MIRQWGDPIINTTPKSFNSHSQLLIFEQDGKEIKRACIVVGSLAIHDDLVDDSCFQISHVPTRTSFMKAVPALNGVEYNHEQLISWCKAVQSKHLEWWEALNRLTPENYRSELKYIASDLRELQEWCLSWAI